MSVRSRKVEQQTVPAGSTIPSLAALFHRTLDIAGSGKRKIDGTYAATRLGSAMTNRWANERFRQVMLLVRQFRTEWPNQSLLTANDTEFIRSAVDVALSSAAHEEHTGDVYDLNSTTWAIWMVQHVRAWFACDANHPIARAYSLPVRLGGCQAHSLFRLFITKGKAERRGVFRPKGLFAFSLLLARLFRGGSTEVV